MKTWIFLLMLMTTPLFAQTIVGDSVIVVDGFVVYYPGWLDTTSWSNRSKWADTLARYAPPPDSSYAPICPVCGDTANFPNKPLAIGDDNSFSDDVFWIPSCKVFICDRCGCLFVRISGRKYINRLQPDERIW